MQNSTVNADENGRYGLGWWVTEDLRGFRSLRGQGGTDDAWAALQIIPSEGIAVVILSNTGDNFPSKLTDEILSVMLPSYRKNGAIANSSPAAQPPPATPAPFPSGNWVGRIQTYKGDLPTNIFDSGIRRRSRPGSDRRPPRFCKTHGLAAALGNSFWTADSSQATWTHAKILDQMLTILTLSCTGKIRSCTAAVTTRTRSGSRFSARLVIGSS